MRFSNEQLRVGVCVVSLVSCGCLLTAADAGCRGDQDWTLTIVRAPDTPEDTISVQATLKNVSDHELNIGVEGPFLDYHLTVTDGRGVLIPLSPNGKALFSNDHVQSSMAVIIKLVSGESRMDTWNIGRLYQFQRPGRCLIRVGRNVGDKSICANTLQIGFK